MLLVFATEFRPKDSSTIEYLEPVMSFWKWICRERWQRVTAQICSGPTEVRSFGAYVYNDGISRVVQDSFSVLSHQCRLWI